MFDDRVIIPFPSDRIRLNGILQDTLSAVHCATNNLTYKDYLSIRSTFLLVSHAVVMAASKSVSVNGEISLDTKIAITFAEKYLGAMSDEIVLTSLLITSIEKSIAIYSKFGLESFIKASAEKSVDALINEFSISGKADFLLEKALCVYSSIGLGTHQPEIGAEKKSDTAAFISEISGTANLICEKYTGNFINDIEFSSTVKFALAKFRLLMDIDSLSFAGIDGWTMDMFDMIRM